MLSFLFNCIGAIVNFVKNTFIDFAVSLFIDACQA